MGMSMNAYLDHGSESDLIAESDLSIYSPEDGQPFGMGYYHKLELEFTVPGDAQIGDTIRFYCMVDDLAWQMDSISIERPVVSSYPSHRNPTLSNATITPDTVASSSQLSDAQLYFQWYDYNRDISDVKLELTGEYVANRAIRTVSASSLGISGSSGVCQKSLGELYGGQLGSYMNNFTKDYWVLLRVWLVDSRGLESENGFLFFYVDGTENKEIFTFKVGDSRADGHADDVFGLALSTWGAGVHHTPLGGTEKYTAYLSDIIPGRNCTLTVQCELSGPEENTGSCVVQLYDGAVFPQYSPPDTATKKKFDITYNPGDLQRVTLEIDPPEPVPPPPPGS
jgi:hypothetical protein